ncbi:MAG: hypothetical protein RL640_1028, partial [Bacteroidota bacterium]
MRIKILLFLFLIATVQLFAQ